MSGTWRCHHSHEDDNVLSSSKPDLRANQRNPRDAKHYDQPPETHKTQWIRGQRLPSLHPDAQRSGGNDSNRSRYGNDHSIPQNSNELVKVCGPERKRATFSAAPINAWGKTSQHAQVKANESTHNLSDQNEHVSNEDQSTLKNGDQLKKGIKAATLNAPASRFPSSMNKQMGTRSQHNPWCKVEKTAILTPNNTLTPFLVSAVDKKQTSTVESSQISQSNETSSIVLPTTSFWGKKQSKALSIDKPNVKTVTIKVDDFPSLSSATSKPWTMLHPQSNSLSKEVKELSVKEKGTTSKPTNLASFLPPQLTSDKKSKTPASSSKYTTTNKVANAIKKNTSGVKRSINPSTNVPSGSKLQSFHPSMIKNIENPVLKRGRQRLTPKKKKLTTLKKRVLEERLRVWKERNDVSTVTTEGVSATNEYSTTEEIHSSSTILIENFISPEEDNLLDDDEYEEIVSNVLSLARRVGNVASVYVPRPALSLDDEVDISEVCHTTTSLEKYVGSSFVRFFSQKDAIAGRDILDGIVVGGQKIHVSILHVSIADDREETLVDDKKWKLAVLQSMKNRPERDNDTSPERGDVLHQDMVTDPSSFNTIVFHNILSADDYYDEDALAESLEDISSLAKQYGVVNNARVVTSGSDKGNVYVSFVDDQSANIAAKQMSGIVIGGSQVLVSTEDKSPPGHRKHSGAVEVILVNILNENDFQDEDCLNESLEDISGIAQRYGVVGHVYADTTGEQKGTVHIEYLEGEKTARYAAQELDGMLIGGSVVSGSVSNLLISNESATASKDSTEKQHPPPIYSGEKIIPERFAACKRVPKIPNSGPRSYAVKIEDDRAVPLLIEILGELMRLQERSKDDKNARARRRLVMGLREVARGIRAHKVKMVVMANNLDEYGAIDAKLQEILEIARAEDVPVVFEFNKRKLGKAIGKSIKVSVVGIQSADGAQEQFKKLKKIIGVS